MQEKNKQNKQVKHFGDVFLDPKAHVVFVRDRTAQSVRQLEKVRDKHVHRSWHVTGALTICTVFVMTVVGLASRTERQNAEDLAGTDMLVFPRHDHVLVETTDVHLVATNTPTTTRDVVDEEGVHTRDITQFADEEPLPQ